MEVITTVYRVGQKSKLLILSKYVNETEKTGGRWTNTNSGRENEALSDIFTWNILRHSCIMFTYSMTESSQWNYCYANTNWLRKILQKKYSIEYLTTDIELVLPTFKSWTDHKIIEYLTSDYCSAFEISQYNSLLFWPTLYRLLMLYTACSRRCYWCDSQTPACFAGGNVTDPGTKAGQAE